MARIHTVCWLFALTTSFARADGIAVTIERVDGSEASGRLVSLVPQGILKSDDDKSVSFALDDLAAIRTADAQTPRTAKKLPFWIELADGSQFSCVIQAMDRERVILQTTMDATAQPPLDAIHFIRNTKTTTAAASRFDESIAAREAATDVIADDELVVAKGDQALVLRGTVRGLSADRVAFTWNERDIDVPWQRVAGVIFGRFEKRSAACTVLTTDGARFCGQIAASDVESVTLQSGALDGFPIPWSRIAEIRVQSRRVTYLSALSPSHYEHSNLLGLQWQYGMDRALDSGPLLLAEKTYARGVVLHSDSRLEFPLQRRFATFTATVGVLDRYPEGSARVRIVGDNRELWSAENVKAREATDVELDITGVATLEIFVERGANLDLGDHVLFADAKLIRADR